VIFALSSEVVEVSGFRIRQECPEAAINQIRTITNGQKQIFRLKPNYRCIQSFGNRNNVFPTGKKQDLILAHQSID